MVETLQEQAERLQELDKLKSNFVSTVSHELRTSLVIIGGSINNILNGLAGDLNDKAKNYLGVSALLPLIQHIVGKSGRLAHMYHNILWLRESSGYPYKLIAQMPCIEIDPSMKISWLCNCHDIVRHIFGILAKARTL